MNKLEEKDEKISNDIPEELGKKTVKKNKKLIIMIIFTLVAICIIGILSTIFAIVNMGNNKILNGIYVAGIDLSNLTKEEAVKKLQDKTNEKLSSDIILKYKEYNENINLSLIETEYNIEGVVDNAYKIGRDGNIIQNNYSILDTIINKKNMEINVTINEDSVIKLIENVEANMPDIAVQNDYYIDGEELIIKKGKEGIACDKEKVISKLYDELNNLKEKSEYIEIPVYTQYPEPIDIEKIHNEVYKEPKDAYYTTNPFTLYPEVNGIDFDIESAKGLLNEEKDEYVIKLTVKKPTVTTSMLGSEIFPNELGTFTTKYDVSNTNRTTNLRLATNKINGTVLLPGEEFSYNKVVGERTISAGYKEAKIYSNGQVVDGLGGGICQISSTLYNAVVFANLDVTVRRNHMFVTSYVSQGRDATVVYGSQDFKFKNNRKYPVKIVASVSNGIAKISIYGIKEEKEYDISFETRTVSTIPYNTKYEESATLDEGTEKVKQKGVNGIVTETYKITKLNGAVVSRTFLSKDTYRAMEKIVIKGTKKAETTIPETSTPSNIETVVPEETTPQIPEAQQPVTPEQGSEIPSNTQNTTSDETNTNSSNSSNTTINNDIQM